jgi:phytoene dehydrogenase-like protein
VEGVAVGTVGQDEAMTTARAYDAVVVGAGPNGLAAAITLAREGCSVLLVEGHERIGGGSRSAALIEPDVIHDVCSAIHPLGLASPFFRSLDLERHGLEWVYPDAPLAHPLDGGRAAVLERDIAATAARLGPDEHAYRRLMEPLVRTADALMEGVLGPLRVPRHPVAMGRFALAGVRSAERLVQARFTGESARALLAGSAAHSIMPLSQAPTAAFGLVLQLLGHAVGWPVARGGSQQIVDALGAELRRLGGAIETGCWVTSVDELPPSQVVLLDVTPRQVLTMAGHRLPDRYRRALERYRYGPGVCKVDWVLDGPVPWASAECLRAGTVHLGGTFAEIAAAEDAVARGHHAERPFVLLAQQSLFDPTRVPAGRQAVWAYCHVPHGSPRDVSSAIEAQVERFAPGFRDRIVGRQVVTAAQMSEENPNYVGGDINGGILDLRQLFTRPAVRPVPYSTPDPRLFLCSSSTPPGGGVHGMCGVFAAKAALRRVSRAG